MEGYPSEKVDEEPRNRIYSEDSVAMKSDLSGISRQMGRYTDGRPRPADQNVCFLCQMEAITYAALVNHFKAAHPAQFNPRVCCICAKSYATVQNHVDLVHRYIRNNRCDTCGKCYFAKCDLVRHQMSVHEKVQFKCTLCPKICTSDGHIRDHYFNVHRSRITFKTPNGPEVADVKPLTEEEVNAHLSRSKIRGASSCHPVAVKLPQRPSQSVNAETPKPTKTSLPARSTVATDPLAATARIPEGSLGALSFTPVLLKFASDSVDVKPFPQNPNDHLTDPSSSSERAFAPRSRPSVEIANAPSRTGDTCFGGKFHSSNADRESFRGEQDLAKRKSKESAVEKPKKKRRSSLLDPSQQSSLQDPSIPSSPNDKRNSSSLSQDLTSSSARVEHEMSTISLRDLGTDLEALEAFRRQREAKDVARQEEEKRRNVVVVKKEMDDPIFMDVLNQKNTDIPKGGGTDIQSKLALFECLTCGQRYGHRNLIEYHLVNKHHIHASEIDPNFKFCFMCTLCDALFPSEHVLSLHQEQSHPEEIAQSWSLNQTFLRRNGVMGRDRCGAGSVGATIASLKRSAISLLPDQFLVPTMPIPPVTSFPGLAQLNFSAMFTSAASVSFQPVQHLQQQKTKQTNNLSPETVSQQPKTSSNASGISTSEIHSSVVNLMPVNPTFPSPFIIPAQLISNGMLASAELLGPLTVENTPLISHTLATSQSTATATPPTSSITASTATKPLTSLSTTTNDAVNRNSEVSFFVSAPVSSPSSSSSSSLNKAKYTNLDNLKIKSTIETVVMDGKEEEEKANANSSTCLCGISFTGMQMCGACGFDPLIQAGKTVSL